MSVKIEKNDTLTGICNSALAMAGHTDFIDNIEGQDNVSVICRALLEQVCKEVQSHEFAPWDELMVDKKLVKKGYADGTKRRIAYNLPLDFLVPVECYQEESGRKLRHHFVGGLLVSDEDTDVWLRYIKFSIDPAEWSAELRTCVIKLLSARIIAALVKDYGGAQKAEQQFWQFDFGMWAASKRNKAGRSDYKGDDGAISRGIPGSGNLWADRY